MKIWSNFKLIFYRRARIQKTVHVRGTDKYDVKNWMQVKKGGKIWYFSPSSCPLGAIFDKVSATITHLICNRCLLFSFVLLLLVPGRVGCSIDIMCVNGVNSWTSFAGESLTEQPSQRFCSGFVRAAIKGLVLWCTIWLLLQMDQWQAVCSSLQKQEPLMQSWEYRKGLDI